jgi:hypothetical protein
MRKLITILVTINILAALIAGLVYYYWEMGDPNNGFNGIIWALPMFALLGSGILFLVVTFATALKKTTFVKLQDNTQRHRNIAISILASFIPLLLLYFSVIGENRGGLQIVAVVGIIICLLSVIFNLLRSPRE